MKLNKFDIVKCPFDEIGLIRKVETKNIWGNNVMVEIINTIGVMNNHGDIVEYKPEDLIIIKKLEF